MKFIDKTILAIFSIIILAISLVAAFLALDLIEVATINSALELIKDGKIITLSISAVLVLMSIKGIFFKASIGVKEKQADGVLLKNENGKLVISKETIENVVNGVAKGFNGTQNVSTKLSVINNNISVFVNMQIIGDVSIAALSVELQNKIKDSVKRIANIDLKEVNIRVKNISDVQTKTPIEVPEEVSEEVKKEEVKKEEIVEPQSEEKEGK